MDDEPKHLYWNQRGDWFVATSLRHAEELARHFYVASGIPPHAELITFTQEPDDSVNDFGTRFSRPCGEWAARCKPGFFAEDEG
jgi:hypothetical protein